MKVKSLIFILIFTLAFAACGPSERHGVYMPIFQDTHTLSAWNDVLPEAWRNTSEYDAMYRIYITLSDTLHETCEYGPPGSGSARNRIFARRFRAQVTITDLSTGEQVAENEFIGLPPRCPVSAIFSLGETSRTMFGDPPTDAGFERWLMVTFRNVGAGILPTLTLVPSITPTPTVTPRPAHTPQGMTPIPEGNNLIVSGGNVFIRDEHNRVLAQIQRGRFQVIGVTSTSYVILYEGQPAYVSLSVIFGELSTPLP